MSLLDELLPTGGVPAVPDWPAELPDHLSASSLSMLERCPEQWRQRYLLGKKEPPSGAMLWGSVDGKAHAVNFNQKIDSHEDLPVADVREAFASIMDEEVDSYGGVSEIDWRDDDPAKVKDQGVNLVAHYHKQVSPRVQPTATEERFSLQIPDVPVPFIGYIDVSTKAYTIERKTARGSSKVIPPQYVLQTLGYALARMRPVELHISTRTAKPAVYTPQEEPGLLLAHAPLLKGRAERIIASRARALLGLWHERGPDEPWPDAIGTMAWHTPVCDICGFRPDCPWWEGSEPAVRPGRVAFAETSASGKTGTELECETLTRTLLTIAEKRGIDVEAIAATVAANRAAHADEPAAHAGWLRLQLVRAEKAG